MKPHYKTLAVALVPQPREVPLPPFASDDLQAIFAEVGKTFPYQTFDYVFERRGARFSNAEDDFVEIRPAEFQVFAKMDGQDVLNADMAQSKAVRILELAANQLSIPGFLQCTLKVIAVVPLPEGPGDAKTFLAERLMGGIDVSALGDDYFGKTVSFGRIGDDPPEQDQVVVEPYFQDTEFIFVSHQRIRTEGGRLLAGFDQIGNWIQEAFEFVGEPVMQLLDDQGE